jgi:hypothetical protein
MNAILFTIGWQLARHKHFESHCWVQTAAACLNALAQTGWSGPRLTLETWRTTLHTHLREIPWKQALADVEPFLLSQQESSLLTRENLDRLLGGN